MNDNPTKTDKFIEQNQKTKANKDYMIETLYS